jgi:hypothetical protein
VVILRLKSQNHQTIVVSFETQTRKPEATTGFKAKPGEIITTGFEVKPGETVPVILRLNHRQTIDLGFDAQPRYSCSSSPHA